ncbi:2-C-methyl-D-erythritol 2,4-cyclodiphosphate synthase [candidate division KSB1 bacterium]|nr:2-C-methyl-D-erythritol 2,4-cyclodiphosphate synthase [candidate division KSB1 bacterium]
MRVGFGYDIHPLMYGRELILGGVQIPFDRGLQGHSDADVLCHAISDSILGAAALGDIGIYFPDDDPAYKNAPSVELLKQVYTIIRKFKYQIVNIDTTIVAEAPKIVPYREAMVQNIAEALEMSPSCVSIKATTNEHLGPVGRGEAIAVHAVCLIEMEGKK